MIAKDIVKLHKCSSVYHDYKR